MIFLSKYFSKAKENKNKERTEINIDGINVNNEKKVMYDHLMDKKGNKWFEGEKLQAINIKERYLMLKSPE